MHTNSPKRHESGNPNQKRYSPDDSRAKRALNRERRARLDEVRTRERQQYA